MLLIGEKTKPLPVTPATDEEIFGKFPEHLEFIAMVRQSKKMADHIKTKVPICWRGYESSIFPGLKPLSTKDLKGRLKMALQGVFNLSNEEKMVI